MSEYEKKVVEDLRRNARKSGVWSPGKEDMQVAADLIETLCAERDRLAERVQELEKASADVQEVRHGYKGESAFSSTGFLCSVCHSDFDRDAVFCKYCGAKIDGKGDTNAEVD